MSDAMEIPGSHDQAAKSDDQFQELKTDMLRDLMLWRRKNLNIGLLLAATATWTVMEIYQCNFISVLSWVVMAVITCLFFWGSIHRLLKREEPDLSELLISEETANGTANLLRNKIEEWIRLLLHVSVEREWFVSVGVVVFLYLVSVVAKYVDFLTLSYAGLVGGLIIPPMYTKNENMIEGLGRKIKVKSQRLHATLTEKLQQMKSKMMTRKDQQALHEKKLE